MASADLRLTFGAMFIGCVISVFLSGMGTLQTYHYFRHYRKKDSKITVLIVSAIGILDFTHTIFICQGIWNYLILNWGNLEILDKLNWTIAASIAVTGFVTYIVQLFFIYRVWRFSKQNIYLPVFITFLATVRFSSALGTTGQMIRLGKFSTFIDNYRWLFTFGLALSCAIEIFLTSSLCYYLQINRSGHSTMDEIVHRLLIYSISNGILTTTGSFLAMLFAVIMPHSFLFIATHFVIVKCYGNSLLATLNSRDALKKRHDSHGVAYQVSVVGHSRPRFRRFAATQTRNEYAIPEASERPSVRNPSASELKVQIHVEQEVQSDAGRGSSPARSYKSPELSPSEENIHTTVDLPRTS